MKNEKSLGRDRRWSRPASGPAKLCKAAWAVVAVVSGVAVAMAADDGAKAPAPGGVHMISLPAMQPELPPGPGRETVGATCVICHTTRYITMQPRFSRAAWTAEVDKMRKTFGAPVTDAQAAEVVNYLVSIRGAEAAK